MKIKLILFMLILCFFPLLGQEDESKSNSNAFFVYVKQKAEMTDSLFKDFVYISSGQYAKIARDLNYPDLMKEIDKKKDIDTESRPYVEQLKAFKAKYDVHYEMRVKGDLNKYMSYALKGEDENGVEISGEKLAKMYSRLINTCKNMLITLPSHEEITKTLQKLRKEAAARGVLQEDIFVSDFHKENVGKVFFSNEPIIPGMEDEDKFTNSFSWSNTIYALFYYDRRIYPMPGKVSFDPYEQIAISLAVRERKDDKIIYATNFRVFKANNAFVVLEIKPSVEGASFRDAREWNNVFTSVSEDIHTFEIFIEQTGLSNVRGEFTVNLEGRDIKKMDEVAGEAFERAETFLSKVRKLPKRFDRKSARFKDRELSSWKLKRAFEEGVEDCEKVESLICVMLPEKKEWYRHKDGKGTPTKLTTNLPIYVLYLSTDGYFYYTDEVVFKKVYEGDNEYGKLMLDYIEDKYRIVEENINVK